MRLSEDDFTSLFDQAGDLVVLVDVDWRIVSISSAVRQMLGYEPEDLVGRRGHDLFAPDHLDDARERYARLLSAEEMPPTYESVLVSKDGRRVPVEVTTTVLRREGAAVGALGVARDITQRRLAESALRWSEAQLSEAQRSAHIGSWDWDLLADTISWSDEMYRLSGHDPGQPPLGYDAYMARIHPEDRATVVSTVQSALARGGVFETRYRISGPDGQERLIEGHGVVTLDGDGKAVRMAGTARDVTDEQQAREERQRLEEEFLRAQKLEALALLSGEIAHDFNNALTAIRGYAALILDQLDPGTAVARDALELCRTAEHATALPRQLLAFARRQTVTSRELELGATLLELRPLLVHLLGVERTLVVETADREIWVRADPGQLEQALVNVTLNARDAMEDTGDELAVAVDIVEIDATDSELAPGRYGSLRITDDGVGMDEATLARAAEPFFTTKHERGGTGLGLPAVVGGVTQSGGAVRISSEPGSGTTVEILLPAVEKPALRSRPTPAGGRERVGATVLVVDDEPHVLAVIARVLGEAGYDVLATHSPSDALERIRAESPEVDLLVTDLRMPELSGVELAVSAREAVPDLAVLFLSGFPEDIPPDDADSLLTKPFAPEELVAAVERRLIADVDTVQGRVPHGSR